MKIAVAGTGYVGLVAGVCFAEVGHDVTCVDVNEAKVEIMRKGISPIYEEGLEELMVKNNATGRLHYTVDYQAAYRDAEVIFIGVGTPEQADGSANLSFLNEVVKQIAESVERDCLVVIKSTVPIGTNDRVEGDLQAQKKHPVRIEVASNPEFLSQGTAVRDTLQAARIVIGTESPEAEETLLRLYEPFDIPIVSVNRRTAEMIKYASNDFLALKISYMNDLANLCERVGANIQDVAKGMGYDKRIGDKFLNAGVGYGGSCFPKDTKALAHLARENGYVLKTVEAAIEVNTQQKTVLLRKAEKRFSDFKGLKVAVLGLTFKPGTDDLREAPSLDNVPVLLERGAKVYAYDPVGAESFRKIYPEGVTYCETPQAALQDADLCFIFTEWNEIKAITPQTYGDLMKMPVVFDGRNLYDLKEMKAAGVEYDSIGRV